MKPPHRRADGVSSNLRGKIRHSPKGLRYACIAIPPEAGLRLMVEVSTYSA